MVRFRIQNANQPKWRLDACTAAGHTNYTNAIPKLPTSAANIHTYTTQEHFYVFGVSVKARIHTYINIPMHKHSNSNSMFQVTVYCFSYRNSVPRSHPTATVCAWKWTKSIFKHTYVYVPVVLVCVWEFTAKEPMTLVIFAANCAAHTHTHTFTIKRTVALKRPYCLLLLYLWIQCRGKCETKLCELKNTIQYIARKYFGMFEKNEKKTIADGWKLKTQNTNRNNSRSTKIEIHTNSSQAKWKRKIKAKRLLYAYTCVFNCTYTHIHTTNTYKVILIVCCMLNATALVLTKKFSIQIGAIIFKNAATWLLPLVKYKKE